MEDPNGNNILPAAVLELDLSTVTLADEAQAEIDLINKPAVGDLRALQDLWSDTFVQESMDHHLFSAITRHFDPDGEVNAAQRERYRQASANRFTLTTSRLPAFN